MDDHFYAVFCRVEDDDGKQHFIRAKAESAARKCAAKYPQHEFFIMESVCKFAGEKLNINRTEIEPGKRT